MRKIIIEAHRGARAEAPENWLAAFQPIDPGQQLGNRDVELRRNALVEVDLQEERDEFG